MQNFFGTDDIAWTDTNLGGQTRSFTHASTAMNEVVDARVWSGIHFLRADVHGRSDRHAGRRLGERELLPAARG